MKTIIFAYIFVILTISTSMSHAMGDSSKRDDQKAGQDLLKRLMGRRSRDFNVTLVPVRNGKDVASYKASNGHVWIQGSNGVMIAHATYEYLKRFTHSGVFWEGTNIDLPARLPDAPLTKADAVAPI